MSPMRHRLLPSRTERTIVVARIVLAASSLFAVWLDPSEPQRYATATYTLHSIYIVYALILALTCWNRAGTGRLPIVTHLADIAVFSVFQYLTLGPSSPFFMYFVFSLFCGALRWGWRGTFGTAVLVLVSFLAMGLSMSRTLGPAAFELNRFIIRTVYLCVLAGLLLYLGQHETRLRREIERLARWPAATGGDVNQILGRVLEQAARIVEAGHVLVAWDSGDEPWLNLASWSSTELTITRHGPDQFDPLVAPDLAKAIILCPEPPAELNACFVGTAGTYAEWRGRAFHPDVLKRLPGVGVVSAPFASEHVSGRAFFSELSVPTAELMALTEVVVREIGTSIEQLAVTEHLREIAVSEQRLRVARDLHDGVLQSLTGIRLELQNLASDVGTGSPDGQRDRLIAIERAVAIEQRELRMFIDSLKPRTEVAAENTLLSSLDALRDRVALEWKVPLTIRVAPRVAAIPDRIGRAVPPMVHEAVVNALKHSDPSRIWVDVDVDNGTLRIVVGDDGHGFAFRGRYDHAALAEARLGPTSLRDRTASLGGQLTIESEGYGSRIEIALPLEAAGVA